ncbi:FAD-dependent oxidoreductase [Streptomyces luomodiensis]|uniref:FAD-dependent oxidoreductase n=1 Tax=Streptomyces luomodiensis TaxID=3026192 RepID=A0ABY9URU7_9ACTN|nr:FAD-dependent oxidoreductase [Streptomyces sp. SCA4-21]WNE95282.1 FAD-dependent oxidoreductase [Streptomyces sp. SCA4-21]
MDAERSGARVAVVGGGWSGIAAAWNLHRAGARPVLFDEQPVLGGRSAAAPLGSREVTLGGKNIGRTHLLFREFVRAQGIPESAFEHFGINSSRVEDGRVRTVDTTSKAASLYGLLRGVPPRDLVRLLRLARYTRRARANRFLAGPDFQRLADRTGDPSLAAYFGKRLRDRLIRPALIRMNGAEPDEAYLGNFGTNLGMLLDGFDQLPGGFTPLLTAFSAAVETRGGTRVTGLRVAEGRVTGLFTTTGEGAGAEEREESADAVVVALPAPAAAALVAPHHAGLAERLREVRYFPVSVVIAAYDRPVFDERVRALTFPPESPLSNAGAYGVSDRHLVRYTFSGRAARDLPADEEYLIGLAEKELGAHLDLGSVRRTGLVCARWEHGLCAYSRFHSRTLAEIDAAVAALDGLALTGDYVRGAAIEACFRGAYERTDALLAALTSRSGRGQLP